MNLVRPNNFKLFKRQGSRLQEICTLTGTSVKIEFTERQPVVAYLKDGPRQERFGAAKVVNRRAQQHVRHFALLSTCLPTIRDTAFRARP